MRVDEDLRHSMDDTTTRRHASFQSSDESQQPSPPNKYKPHAEPRVPIVEASMDARRHEGGVDSHIGRPVTSTQEKVLALNVVATGIIRLGLE